MQNLPSDVLDKIFSGINTIEHIELLIEKLSLYDIEKLSTIIKYKKQDKIKQNEKILELFKTYRITYTKYIEGPIIKDTYIYLGNHRSIDQLYFCKSTIDNNLYEDYYININNILTLNIIHCEPITQNTENILIQKHNHKLISNSLKPKLIQYCKDLEITGYSKLKVEDIKTLILTQINLQDKSNYLHDSY